MNRSRSGFLVPVLLAILGCGTGPTESPAYTKPPRIIERASWTRHLPGGTFRFQTPSRIGLLVTGQRLASPDEVETYLKQEEREAWEKSAGSQVPYHFYVDGEGNFYEGRKLECEAPSIMNHDPDGLVWIAFLDSRLDIHVNEEAREKLVHLLAYLCFSYNISPDAFVLECETEAETGRLCVDLGGTLIRKEVELAIQQTLRELNENPTGYLQLRTRQLRTQPSPD